MPIRHALILALLLLGTSLPSRADAPPAGGFHVSPAGNDANPGTASEPFASLDRARQMVRTVNAGMTGDLIVHLAPGDYPVTAPIDFAASDSGTNGHEVIYRATGQPGSARLLGGERVTSWQPWQGQIMVANLGLPAFHTLFENGRRARKARFPNLAPDPLLPTASATYLRATGTQGSLREIQYADGALDPTGWDLTDAQVHLWPGGKIAWYTDTVPIASIDPAARKITLAEDTRYSIFNTNNGTPGTGSRFFIQGVLALLDEPGEFHYDEAAGKLYYWPMDGPVADQDIIVPRVRRILSLTGESETQRVEHLRFEGLAFEYTDFTGWFRHAYPSAGGSGETHLYPQYDRQASMPQHREGAVFLENTAHLSFDSCIVSNTGYSAFHSYAANQNNSFQRCLVNHTGIHGFFFEGRYPGEGDVQFLNTVDNCRIHHVGELVGHGAGVQLTQVNRHEISYTVIHDSPRYAVAFGAYVDIPPNHIYVYDNHLHHLRIRGCCQDSGDTAPVYGWGVSDDLPYLSNTIEQLIIDDTRAHSSMTDYAPNAVFLDNDTRGQKLTDIDVRNSQGSAYRTNDSTGHVLTNLSWVAGFDPARLHYETIGVKADHPFAVPPVRLAATNPSGAVSLTWLPVANAASYTVHTAATADGPWTVLAAGLTSPRYSDSSGESRYFRVASIGPLGTESEPTAVVGVFPPPAPGTLSFETDQGYTNGNIAATNGGQGAPFNGQQGWSRSTSDNAGNIFTTSPSGEYPGGQALRSGASGSYIGGKRGIVRKSAINTLVFDAFTGHSVSVGYLGDPDADGLFEHADCGMQFGINGDTKRFIYREAGFGTQFNIPVTASAAWHRFKITVGESMGGNRTISLSAYNLASRLWIDLNGAAPGNDWIFTVTDAQFGVAPEDAVGGYVRLTSNGYVDNLSLTSLGTAYEVWLEDFAAITGDDRRADADPDHDGIVNQLEFVLDGDPTTSDPEILPQLSTANGNFVLTLHRRDDSEAFSNLILQHGTTLADWTDVPMGAAAGISGVVTWTVDENGPDPDLITVSFPMGTDPARFVRFAAAEPPQ
ncbi:right-handed parallel beta-helix repeat-containing protein [Luteolibacter arcticus]|uniref:Right-handed parallel beta-helix repeat-containing protein n=1 Tax=Luteolibacter arcticus TaxID=1581411 RepID=A0ABT3GK54_9BACT|nr:right-handed parallel beta-helix repeat-containing protein [Luteolibacter arcticus]MCW1923905.1 right-handed parallel beta-helix repeat-containing protein [Luteolibacter arcticus]